MQSLFHRGGAYFSGVNLRNYLFPSRGGTWKILIIIPRAVFGDRYGVLFAYVFVDGKNINLKLVRQSLSRYYIKYCQSKKYHNEFKVAQDLAWKSFM